MGRGRRLHLGDMPEKINGLEHEVPWQTRSVVPLNGRLDLDQAKHPDLSLFSQTQEPMSIYAAI